VTAPTVRIGESGRPLSPSQITKYLDCSASWWYKYIDQQPDPANANLALGKAVHSACAAQLRAKMAGEVLPAEMVVHEILEPELDKEVAQAILDQDDDVADLLNMSAALYREWHRSALPLIEPAAVETAVSGEIAGIAVRGIIDCVNKDGSIIDLKTASKKPAGVSHGHAMQLTTYAEITGAKEAAIHTLTKTKTPAFYSHSFPVADQERQFVRSIYPAVADAMNHGQALPNRASLFCSRGNCPFWRSCENDYGGRVKE
jgi:RecB family exonuclease